MNSPLARYAVLAPTVLLSMGLTALGYPPLLRMAVSVAFGGVLIVLVARVQRRRQMAGRW